MKVEITEINKISLKENEVLAIQVSERPSQASIDAIRKVFKQNGYDGKFLIMIGDVELTKITKEK